jgi:hypothetical protein
LGKCLDFGAAQTSGTQVYVSDCNNSTEQQVRVEEVDAQHDVVLHAGSKVLGYRPPQMVATTGGSSGPVSPLYVLELQDRANNTTSATATVGAFGSVTSANQFFALDGDSIILASNRTLAVQIQNSRGTNGAPLVVAARSLADSEFWDFNQIAGSDIDPTSGFVRAGYPGAAATAYDVLLSRLAPFQGSFCQNASPACHASPATPGTVIKIYPGTDINLSGLQPLQIPGGVTIRGSRRGTLYGPLLHQENAPGETILEVRGDNVRITGLRLQGISRSTDTGQPGSRGVLVNPALRTIIDHNDLSNFTIAGVEVLGTQTTKTDACAAGAPSDPLNRPFDAFIAHNFMHHNEMQGEGYGVVASHGGFPLVAGNMFYQNRHAIAADGWAQTGYHAWFNLVLEGGPEQHAPWYLGDVPYHTQDFDMHGTGDNGFGVTGGDYVQIYRNTFLGTNRPNYELRGEPCNYSDFRENVSLQSADGAVNFKLSDIPGLNSLTDILDGASTNFPINVATNRSQFDHSNPTSRLGVGDFDGDGAQDLFLATGAAWYYAPQGSAEWRFLSAKTDPMGTLLFGDFDGDGRTDVVGMDGNTLKISWGGVSDWEFLNTVNAPITDLAVGKFGNHAAGDRRDDIFWADGVQWHISSGGTGPFTAVNPSSFRVKDVRFGDFDGNGTTDVLGIVAGKWMVSFSATSIWIGLPKSLSSTLDGVVVADFDGDGRADIATAVNSGDVWQWLFSSAGATNWISHAGLWRTSPASAAAIGNFDGAPGADVLFWDDDDHLDIVPGGPLPGSSTAPTYSRQDLR